MSDMYVVVRYYTEERSPVKGSEVGFVACADFYNEVDAREYFRWQKKRWRAEEKKYPGQMFEWRLYRRSYSDEGVSHTLLEG